MQRYRRLISQIALHRQIASLGDTIPLAYKINFSPRNNGTIAHRIVSFRYSEATGKIN
jgi:hypothetical protein